MSHDLVLNDRYRLVERLTAGGTGEVWRAADQAPARAAAVKPREVAPAADLYLSRWTAARSGPSAARSGPSAARSGPSVAGGGRGPDGLAPERRPTRRRPAPTYASVAAGTLLLGVIVVGTMWRGRGTVEPHRENQERLPAVRPGEEGPTRHLPADPATRPHRRRPHRRHGQETRPSTTRGRRTSTPRYPSASPSQKPTRKLPRASPSAPDPTPRPTVSTTTPSTPSPAPSPTRTGGLGSEDKV